MSASSVSSGENFAPDWPTCCQEGIESGCIGVQVGGFDRCLAHLDSDDLEHVLSRLSPGADFDARGTKFDYDLLTRVLGAVTSTDGPGSAHPQFRDVRFDHARFIQSANFDHAHFDGTARFDGARFSGYAWFDGARFSKDARFAGARFSKDARFADARFSKDARFADARFRIAQFHGARFSGEGWFGGARFSEHALFGGAEFSGNAWFDGARFSWNAWFEDARFSRNALFGGAEFSGNAWFDRARFSEHVWFDGAQFTGNARFEGAQFAAATSLGPLVAAGLFLDSAVFSRSVVVEVEAGWVSCNRARFEEGAALRVRYASVSLQQVFFDGPSSLQGSQQTFRVGGRRLGQVVEASGEQVDGWDRCAARNRDEHGKSGGQVKPWVPGLMGLGGTDVSELVLTDVDLTWCRFAGAHHLDKLRIEGGSPFHRPPSGWYAGWVWPPLWRWTDRQVLAEEHAWRRQWPGGKGTGWQRYPGEEEPSEMGPERLAVVYRSLRKALEDGKDEAGAGDFYYGEMEVRRHSGALRDRVVLTAYWLVSGYSQRALRAITCVGALAAAITVLLLGTGLPATSPGQVATGTVKAGPAGTPQTVIVQITDLPVALPPPGQRWTWDRTGKALQIALGSVVFRDTAQKLTPAGTWTVTAGRFLGPVLLALALLAIRARVKR